MSELRTLAPWEVFESWQLLIDQLPDESQKCLASRCIKRTLPTVSTISISVALDTVISTKPAAESEAFEELRRDLITLVSQYPESTLSGIAHPVNFALKRGFQGWQGGASSLTTSLFLDLCQRAWDVPWAAFKPSVYYTAVLAIRDTLVDVTQHRLFDPFLKPSDSLREALLKICERFDQNREHPDFSGLNDLTLKKLHILTGVVVDGREPGRFQKDVKTRRPAERQGDALDPANFLKNRDWLERAKSKPRPLESLADVLPEPAMPKPPITSPTDPNDLDPEAMGIGLPGHVPATQIRVRRQAWQHHIAGQQTLSISDIGQHSLAELVQWLAVVDRTDSTLIGFLLIIVATGIKPERLALKRVTEGLPNAKTPFFDIETGRLRYLVERGRSEDIVSLQLPTYFAERSNAVLETHLFPNAIQRYQQVQKKNPEYRLPPISAWLRSTQTIWRFDRDSLTSGVLSGLIPSRRLATSNYVRISHSSLNQAVSSAWELVIKAMAKGQQPDLAARWPTPLATCPPDPIQSKNFVGSVRYETAASENRFSRALHELGKRQVHSLRGPASNRASVWLDLFNLAGLNHYLAYRHLTIGRDLRDTTQLHLDGNTLWMADKQNSTFVERKSFELPADSSLWHGFQIQASECQYALERLGDVAYTHGQKIHCNEADTLLPRCADLINGRIVIERMTAQRFTQLGMQLELPVKSLGPLNSNRHRFATEAYLSIPESHWLEIMGHKHPGTDRFDPESAASAVDCELPAELIDEWMHDAEWCVLRCQRDKCR